ncbi:MAG: M48 family metallopeptidase [Bacteroidia bacterium]|nr:M48 family metallopeptidase [Bacteroidia bacterium]
MIKTFLKGLGMVLTFFLLWFALTNINWMDLFHIEKISKDTDRKLGNLFWETINKTEQVVKDKKLNNALDEMVERICEDNQINQEDIQLHLVQSNEVNAFALPGGHLVVYTGLLKDAKSPESVAGVLCHEIAHIKKDHIMKKLVKEIGMATLLGMASGSAGGEAVKSAAKTLSSNAFDRKLEKEADIQAVKYMINAELDPLEFAKFMEQLAEQESEVTEDLSWLSTHPDSKERAEYIREYATEFSYETRPMFSEGRWDSLLVRLEQTGNQNLDSRD